MQTVYENSKMKGIAQVSCVKYRNLNNISHFHSDYELIFVNIGNAQISINENIFNLKAGEAIFIPPNDIHLIGSNTSSVITVLKANEKYLSPIFLKTRFASPLMSKAAEIAPLLEEIYRELHEKSVAFEFLANSLTTNLFIKLLRNEETLPAECKNEKAPPCNEFYSKISTKISNEYRTITFAEAAKFMYISEPYFSKIFRNIFNMTFTQYLNTVRIAVAVEKLKEGLWTVTEISSDCGFNTIRNFNRVFKKLTGYSPNNLPPNYSFLYGFQEGYGLDPTLNCTEILEYDYGKL